MKIRNDHPALGAEQRTIHTSTLRAPYVGLEILKPVSANGKVGAGSRLVLKGRWKGLPMYSLTLQERATCSRTCEHWATCYGNNMPFAHRWKHGPALERALADQLDRLSRKHQNGYVIRLHILGDFYSLRYVAFWDRMLKLHPGMRVFGYTGRPLNSAIGLAVHTVKVGHPDRWWIRYSRSMDPDGDRMFAGKEGEVEGITCPQQTGQTAGCTTCGLCWSTEKTITFITH